MIEKGGDGWWVGQLVEMPEVISQGKTKKELRVNILDALKLVLAYRREMAEKQHVGGGYEKERFLYQ